MPRPLRLALHSVPLAGLTVAYPLLHKSVSDVFDWASGRWGFAVYQRSMIIGIPLVCVLAALPFAKTLRVSISQPRSAAALLLLTAATIASQYWLMVVNVELVHLPQFAIVSAVALALGFGPHVAFLTGLAAGFVDETYQHLVVYAGRSGTYFDINDIVLNAIGAAWGVVLFARPAGKAADAAANGARGRLPQVIVLLLVAAGLAWWLDPPTFAPMFQMTPASRKLYRVLSAPEGVLWCALLWGVVAFTRWRPNSAGLPGRVSPATTMLLAVMAGLCQSCASAPQAVTIVPPPQANAGANAAVAPSSSFITTFWCGPPLDEFTDARAAEIADAGFTLVGAPCEGDIDAGRSRKALDVAARHGLKLLVTDGRYGEWAAGQPGWERQAANAAAEYREHPGFGGYFVTDEPSAAKFEALGRITAQLRAAGPELAYINLLPEFIPDGLGTPTYREYIEQFIATVRPSLVSYDYYPFRINGDRPTFFNSLALIRERALAHNLPFMLIVQAMPHGPYRDPSEAEVAWQAFHALAFGARGLSYFAYWTPVNVAYADRFRFRHGLIEGGKPTRHYYEAQRLNREVRAIASQLEAFRSVAVGDSRGEIAAPFPIGPIAAIRGGTITAGLFEDANGRQAVLLVNRNYEGAAEITVRMRGGAPRGQRFDAERASWSDVGERLRLAAGGAVLLRWPASPDGRP